MEDNPRVGMPLRIAAIILLFMVIMLVSVGGFYWLNSGMIIPGVRAMGQDFSNTKKTEALKKLLILSKVAAEKKVPLHIEGKNGTFNLDELGISINPKATVDRMAVLGHRGSFWRRWHERTLVAQVGREIMPVLNVRQAVLKKVVRDFSGTQLALAEDARFAIAGDNVKIIPGKMGRDIDWLLFTRDLQLFLAGKQEQGLVLRIKEVEPQVKETDLAAMNINGLLSSNTTYFEAAKENRAYNIHKAASVLDGLTIAPGQIFSFNEVVGPRSLEVGFRNAPVIENNEMVEGVGGGVCQVSSTLYGAALKADMAIVERSNHSLAITYVPLGQDATVVYGAIDLKLRNPFKEYLLVKIEMAWNHITFKIYGNNKNKVDVSIKNEIIKTWNPKTVYENDPDIPLGIEKVKQRGTPGYIVRSKRLVKKEGVVIREDTLPSSNYEAHDRIISVGKKLPDSPSSGAVPLEPLPNPPATSPLPATPSPPQDSTTPPPQTSPSQPTVANPQAGVPGI